MGARRSFNAIDRCDYRVGLEDTAKGHHSVIAGAFLLGSLTFFGGNALLEKIGNGRSRRSNKEGSPLAIFMGTALDGIPESIVLGLSLVSGKAVNIAMLVAILISNLPEAVASTNDLRRDRWKPRTIIGMWAIVAVVSGLASLVGFAIFGTLPPLAAAFAMAFAGGALLTMLADAMMSEAYQDTGALAGVLTACGFGVAYWLSQLALVGSTNARCGVYKNYNTLPIAPLWTILL